MKMRLARALSIVPAVALVAAAGSGCSSDSAEKTTNPVGGAGGSTGGGSAAGGSNSSGGSSSSGGSTGAGGMPFSCAFDAGGSECELCLGSRCCDATLSCFGDAGCHAAFDTYQKCEATGTQDQKASCYSNFLRAISPDSGGPSPDRTSLLTCILTSCQKCGTPPVL